ncbi:HAD family hydrolase [Hymenobacter sp. BT683]|uniref:phosphoglycolate phosphatase n=1 Tax=Hymenobacter jeongseonensis TaxID=2791027 RepID=A0ABS0IDR4_9BACT|nr:HAD family hydrolase [Hymenobacter jeongseonensis]MBF9236499.1 HAD family hydrolase [Hymenobacter jeongseonensis]
MMLPYPAAAAPTFSVQRHVQWPSTKAVIFDVDGTLYEQSRLRMKMVGALARYYALRPWRLAEVRLLLRFRAEREKRPGAAGPGLEQAQYAWASRDGRIPGQKIRRVVDQWLFEQPKQYLRACAYPGIHSFFAALRQHGIKIGIYSDYEAHGKLAALGLAADLVVSSTDPEIDHLKPAPHGLWHIAATLGVAPAECLFIGDRPELDGACAAQAGMPWLMVEQQRFDQFTFYESLENGLVTSCISCAP